MEDAPSSPEFIEPKRRTRKKPDLSGVEPKAVTIKTKGGEKTFAARSKPKKEVRIEDPIYQTPWTSVMNSWLD